MQGKKLMSIAFIPAFFSAVLLRPSPARSSITVRARDFREGAKSKRISGASFLKRSEATIPKTTIPKTVGSLMLLKSFPKSNPPKRKIKRIILIERSPKFTHTTLLAIQ